MATINYSIINQMAACIVREVNPARIILFGSAASGQLHEGSDVDLLVIEDAPFGRDRSRFSETGRINRALAGFGVAKDILVFSMDEVERWRVPLASRKQIVHLLIASRQNSTLVPCHHLCKRWFTTPALKTC